MHNNVPSHKSLKRAQRLSNIINNRSQIWQLTPTKYSSGSESENVRLKDRGTEHINTNEEARSNLSRRGNQDPWRGGEDLDLGSNGCLKPPSSSKYPRFMEPSWIFSINQREF